MGFPSRDSIRSTVPQSHRSLDRPLRFNELSATFFWTRPVIPRQDWTRHAKSGFVKRVPANKGTRTRRSPRLSTVWDVTIEDETRQVCHCARIDICANLLAYNFAMTYHNSVESDWRGKRMRNIIVICKGGMGNKFMIEFNCSESKRRTVGIPGMRSSAWPWWMMETGEKQMMDVALLGGLKSPDIEIAMRKVNKAQLNKIDDTFMSKRGSVATMRQPSVTRLNERTAVASKPPISPPQSRLQQFSPHPGAIFEWRTPYGAVPPSRT
ncbi:hypothetical protein B0J13DRAFT_527364 [Dactylonectria estremocensis]|uniref:Uncharacterized protein n=1 Tax=Dactylonectria estremocensis TaxID=1079267 RepID=A0A9P9EKW4_9HYPO|nr:hypothetical protein B0J13DRAFT_527364 [Dactylonectria estremocensis]